MDREKCGAADTYEAVGVLGARAASCAFSVAAFADGAPVAAPVALLGTHHLRYWREQENQTGQWRKQRAELKLKTD